MRLAVAAFCTIFAAQPGLALSCAQTNIADDFQRAVQSEDAYIVVRGDLRFDEDALPKPNQQNQTRSQGDTNVPAWLDGYSLSKDGFTRRFRRDVVLRISCVAQWCGGASQGDHIVFLKREDESFVLQSGPCSRLTYDAPTPEQESTLLSCMRAERCGAH